jgi:UDP-glucose 4-epimerase
VTRAVVTGGAGFVGSHLADALRDRGDDVLVIDDLSKGRDDRLDGVAFVRGDVRDGPALARVVGEHGTEVVFHLAAQADVRASVADPVADLEINVAGTVHALEAARAVGARVVFASTGGAIYGDTDERPTPETAPTSPEAPYGTAKLCAEEYLRLYNRLHGTRHCILRLGNVYGPRQDPAGEAGVVSIFAGRIVRGEAPPLVFGDGRQTRDYVYVGDVVDAFLAAADAGATGCWNVGTGVETSVLDLLAGFAAVTGRAVEPEFAPARAGELEASALDGARAAADLGFRPRVGLEDGLARVYRWVEAGEPVRAPLA